MQYLNMLPYQIRENITKKTPVILPLGVVEYHAEHLPLGTDTWICTEVLARIEKRRFNEIIILPPFHYCAASLAVAAPENKGTIHVDAEKISPAAQEIFNGLLRVGFRNIHCFIAHQTEEFYQGMPTDLAFRLAARQSIFKFMDKKAGEGWWGQEQFSNYYSADNNPFEWIQVHPILVPDDKKAMFPGDHAGTFETSIMLARSPELVQKARIDGSIWFARSGKEASAEYGEAALAAMQEYVENIIFGK